MTFNEDIIIEPIITEKTNLIRENGKFSFRVDARANKIQVVRAIEKLFEVKPIACNIMNVKPKPRRQRYKSGRTSSWKKAIVTLKKGDTIPIFEGV